MKAILCLLFSTAAAFAGGCTSRVSGRLICRTVKKDGSRSIRARVELLLGGRCGKAGGAF